MRPVKRSHFGFVHCALPSKSGSILLANTRSREQDMTKTIVKEMNLAAEKLTDKQRGIVDN